MAQASAIQLFDMTREPASYQAVFQDISSTTHQYITSLQQGDSPCSSFDPTNSPSCIIPALRLHHSDISSTIIGQKSSSSPAGAIAGAFLRSSRDLRELYESRYDKIARFLASDPNNLSSRLHHLRTFFERQYVDQIISIEHSAVAQIQTLQDISESTARPKPLFNQVCLCILSQTRMSIN